MSSLSLSLSLARAPVRWLLRLLVTCLIPVFLSPFCYADTLQEAVNQAALDFKVSGKLGHDSQIVLSTITNYHSCQRDRLAVKVETELLHAFGTHFPHVQLIDVSASLTGVSSAGKIFIRGSYERKSDVIIVRLKALKGMLNGELLAQTKVIFDTDTTRSKALVAVLDLEAKSLTAPQRKAFSDVFRSYLAEADLFEISSSADIDKMSPDQIQKATGCTRDECATIIGEQLGVDRVISSSLFKIGDRRYILSAKVMDINNGSILATRTVEHNNSPDRLNDSLRELSSQLTGRTEKLKTKPESKLNWHMAAVGLAVTSTWLYLEETSSINSLQNENETTKSTYESTINKNTASSLKAQYDDTNDKIATKQLLSYVYGLMALGSLAWEGYLIFDSPTPPETTVLNRNFNLRPIISAHRQGIQFQYKW